MRQKPPIHITLLICLVLYITVWHAIRLFASIAWSYMLKVYEPGFLPLYIAITGALWCLSGAFLLWSMWRGWRWTRKTLLTVSSLYVQTRMRANWPFDLVLTVILLAFAVFIVLEPRNKIYFERETYERKS